MAGENTLATAQGLYKKIFADKMIGLVPEFAVLGERVPYVPTSKQPGELYAQPVILSMENGVTYLGDAGSVSALNAAANHVIREAQVKGSEINLRSQISYKALAAASSGGDRAFTTALKNLLLQMNRTVHKRLELVRLYGQKGLGTVSSFSTSTLVVTAASWSAGIWAGMEGAVVDVYQSDLATVRQANLTIGSVDSAAKSIVFSNATITTSPAANDVIFFKGANNAGTFNEGVGLQKIIQNTGTLFNVSASTYNLWQGNQNTTAGNLSFDRLQEDCMKAMSRGLMERVLVLVSPISWAALNSDQAALRVFDSSYSTEKGKNGVRAIEFYAATGVIEIVAHPFVKDGDYFIVPPEYLLRIGSTDVTFQIPGKQDEFMRLVDGYNAVEFQCMVDEQIFLEMPAHAIFGTGVTHT